MNDENDIATGIPAIIQAARDKMGAEIVDVATGAEIALWGSPLDGVPMIAVPQAGGGVALQSTLAEVKAWRDAFATRPILRQGTATLEELGSFTAHATRFADKDSAIFVSGGAAAPKFTSVLDYHPKGGAGDVDPRFGKHRGIYEPKFSPAWEAWKDVDGKTLSQAEFAKLITDHVRDVLDVREGSTLAELPGWFALKHGRGQAAAKFFASSDRMLELADGLTLSVSESVTDAVRQDTGETSIAWSNTIDTSAKGVSVVVPVAFVLELEVFPGSGLYQLPCRLRFAKRREGDMWRAAWTVSIFGADETVKLCVDEMREKIGTATKLPIFAGSPE